MQLREVAGSAATLTVREWGEPGGTPFLFWHSVGPGGSGAMFDVAARPLAQTGFHVLAADAPGFGRSPALPADGYSLDRLAALFWELSDALDLEAPVLAGHSWGGAVAVAAASIRPEQTRALVLFDSGHCDYADWPGADLTSTRDGLIAAAAQDSALTDWDALLGVLREHDLAQEWMLSAWREAVDEIPDGGIRLRVDSRARGAALYELTHARPSESWPAIAAAGVPTLLLLADQPADVGEANELLLPRFLDAVPQAKVMRPGCRHQIFADLGARSGDLVVEWLQRQGIT